MLLRVVHVTYKRDGISSVSCSSDSLAMVQTRGEEGDAASCGRWRGLPVALSCFRQTVAAPLARRTFADTAATLSLSKQCGSAVCSVKWLQLTAYTMVTVKMILVRLFVCMCERVSEIGISLLLNIDSNMTFHAAWIFGHAECEIGSYRSWPTFFHALFFRILCASTQCRWRLKVTRS